MTKEKSSELPYSLERSDTLNKIKDAIIAPALNQVQEVHQMTILEENETMRGSLDKSHGISAVSSFSLANKKRAT